jgi:mono/diheme cytochrome c family protein
MMKKSFGLFAGTLLLAISFQVTASVSEEIGAKIYDRAFGRGCATCHDIASNPQLKSLIKANKLPLDQFSKVVKNGKKACPKSSDAIMQIGEVKKYRLTLNQAIADLYEYLRK